MVPRLAPPRRPGWATTASAYSPGACEHGHRLHGIGAGARCARRAASSSGTGAHLLVAGASPRRGSRRKSLPSGPAAHREACPGCRPASSGPRRGARTRHLPLSRRRGGGGRCPDRHPRRGRLPRGACRDSRRTFHRRAGSTRTHSPHRRPARSRQGVPRSTPGAGAQRRASHRSAHPTGGAHARRLRRTRRDRGARPLRRARCSSACARGRSRFPPRGAETAGSRARSLRGVRACPRRSGSGGLRRAPDRRCGHARPRRRLRGVHRGAHRSGRRQRRGVLPPLAAPHLLRCRRPRRPGALAARGSGSGIRQGTGR
ncbi:hypothetical protein SRABI03_03117 [Microbacterium foliorum]|nr:hypothetical protein SRABI03_03117 [Microbacterium foliorum]